jgi:hypothetical protein
MAELNGQQFNYPKTEDDPGFEQFRRVHELHGAGDVNAAFGDRLKTSVPWPRASRRKDRMEYDQDVVRRGLSQPAQVEDVDPRYLHVTQPHIVRAGVAHYMGDEYDRTGRTFADQGNVGNAFPVVYDRDDGYRLLLSGHHRATAALLKGRGLQARRFSGPWGPER